MGVLAKLDKALAGWPEHLLSVVLLAIAVVSALIAWRGSAALKAFAAAWFLLP